MTLMETVVAHAEELTRNKTKYVIIHGDFDGNVVLEIGLVRSDGVQETPHATRKYYEKNGETYFLIYPHC
jgi:hypothetical protein